MDESARKALQRYQVISAYLALDPPRGKRRQLLEQLAQKVWRTEAGEPFTVAAETIRVWIRRYRGGGLPALADTPRPQRGVSVLSEAQQQLLIALKQEVPERTLDRIIKMVDKMKLGDGQVPSRSTLHRVLQQAGVSGRPPPAQSDTDLDRFEASFPSELWQSDLLKGPWLPDPQRPGKRRRAVLYAFIDDHSRLLLHGRFSFKEDLPLLELVLRRCLQRWGLCRLLYYDNGAVYRAGHMKHIAAELGIHPIIYTTTYRPMGHGKIEALNRLIKSAFIAEVKASSITTLDALNEAFMAWADTDYNRSVHSETGQTPRERFKAGLDKVRYAEEEKLRRAFLWKEDRTPDKAGCFSLFGARYQLDTSKIGRQRIQVRFDPEALDELEIWHKDRFVQRCHPFKVQRHRRPKSIPDAPSAPDENDAAAPPVADYLGHLVVARRADRFIEPEPSAKALVEQARARRLAADQAVIDLLLEYTDRDAIDIGAAKRFLDRYGPFDVEQVETVLRRLLSTNPADQHVTFYLEAIRHALAHKED
jgi:transposase InsO family protein